MIAFYQLPLYCRLLAFQIPVLLKQEFAASKSNIRFYADEQLQLAHSLNAEMTPQIYLLNNSGSVVYSGLLNDYYTSINIHKTRISKHYAEEALLADMEHKPVSIPQTTPVGCFIEQK